MKKIQNILFSIIFSIFIIGLCVRVGVGFRQLYYFDIDYLKLEERTRYTKEEMKLNYDYLIDYNLGKVGPDFKMPTIPSSVNGTIHFEEVRVIIQTIIKAFYVCGILVIIGLIINYKQRNIEVLKITAITLIAMPLIIATPLLINFNKSFILFHEIMFDNDYWMFDPHLDPVINILPEEFFMHAGLLILGLMLICSITLYVVYRKLKKKAANRI
jgi:integral membrane protein (TIGR01906 family)